MAKKRTDFALICNRDTAPTFFSSASDRGDGKNGGGENADHAVTRTLQTSIYR